MMEASHWTVSLDARPLIEKRFEQIRAALESELDILELVIGAMTKNEGVCEQRVAQFEASMKYANAYLVMLSRLPELQEDKATGTETKQ